MLTMFSATRTVTLTSTTSLSLVTDTYTTTVLSTETDSATGKSCLFAWIYALLQLTSVHSPLHYICDVYTNINLDGR